MKRLVILPAVVMMLTFMAFWDGRALALSCGDTITTHTKLNSDLTCTTTPGLIIGANGVTLDLNGHTISGVACSNCHGVRNGCAAASGCSPAKLGFKGVTIKNGTIIGFEQGIRAEGVISFKLQNLNITGQTSSSAIDILDSKNVSIEYTTIFIPSTAPSTVEGIRLESVDGVRVEYVNVDGGSVGVNFACGSCDGTEPPTNGEIMNSTFANNGNGIFLPNTTNATVEWNVVTGSGGTSILVGLKCFVITFPPVTNVNLSKNVVFGGGSRGIGLCDVSNSEVSYNAVTTNVGDGIGLLGSTSNEIEYNTASSNGGDGMDLDSTSTGNQIEENTANGNSAFGYDDATAGTGTAGTDNTYEDNRCTLNTSGGSDPSGLCVPQP